MRGLQDSLKYITKAQKHDVRQEMKDGRRQYVGGPAIKKAHDDRREKGQERIWVAIKNKSRKVSEGKKDTHAKSPFHRIADSVLKETSEISLFGQRNADKMKKYRASREKGKGLSGLREKKPEGQQQDERYYNPECAVLQGKSEIDPAL